MLNYRTETIVAFIFFSITIVAIFYSIEHIVQDHFEVLKNREIARKKEIIDRMVRMQYRNWKGCFQDNRETYGDGTADKLCGEAIKDQRDEE